MAKLNLTISLPAQSLNSLSFAKANSKGIEQWLHDLPFSNTAEMSNQLYMALGELNKLKTSPQTRLELLKLIHPAFEHAQKDLGKLFLNKPVMMTTQAKKTSDAAQKLRSRFAKSWLIVAVQQTQKKLSSASKTQAIVAEGLHQAIFQYSEIILTAQKLYMPAPQGTWQDLHHLYLIAEQNNLVNRSFPVHPNEDSALSIKQCYFKALLLACIHSNQLSQKELSSLSGQLADWAQYLKLGNLGHTPHINEYIVPCGDDMPPMYLSHYPGQLVSQCRHLITQPLIKAIQSGKVKLAAGLAEHLCQSLGPIAERGFARRPARGKISVAPGLSDLHYYLSGNIGFERFVDEQTEEDLLAGKEEVFDISKSEQHHEKLLDPWVDSFDAERESKSHKPLEYEVVTPKVQQKAAVEKQIQKEQKQYHVEVANAVDVSPSGFCLSWPNGIPAKIQSGEVIGVQDKQNNWQIAAVRWVTPDENRIGVEILNPTAIPAAIKLPKRTANSDVSNRFLRALILPAMPALGIGMSIILPKLPIRTRQKIELLTHNDIELIQLGRRLSGTGSYLHYEFHRAKDPGKSQNVKLSFDS